MKISISLSQFVRLLKPVQKEELAILIGTSVPYLYHYSNERRHPDPDSERFSAISKYAQSFGINIEKPPEKEVA